MVEADDFRFGGVAFRHGGLYALKVLCVEFGVAHESLDSTDFVFGDLDECLHVRKILFVLVA